MAATFTVFDWKRIPTWRARIEEFVPAELRADLIARISNARENFQYVDDTPVFEELYGHVGDFESLLDRFADTFPAAFPILRTYHCCRCLDPASYHARGILVLDAAEASRLFAELYSNHPQFRGITPADIEAAIRPLADSYKRDGYVYFGLDDRYLLKHGKLYLSHGSEYLQALAANLERRTGYNIQDDLRQRGRATVFCVRFPADQVSYDSLRALGRAAFYAWAYEIARGADTTWEIDFAVNSRKPLPPDQIIEHYFPDGF